MSNKCPVYKNNNCILKNNFTKQLNDFLFEFVVDNSEYGRSCQGLIGNCSFIQKSIVENTEDAAVVEQKEEPKLETIDSSTKVSIHMCENPYLVKSDVLVYPINNVLTVDDPLLHRMSRGKIQNELDNFRKPIRMGSVYITSNGGENSKVQSKKIYHSVVAGESRLVNEEDIKSATRKSLHLAKDNKVRNVVMLPPDCGTHDINDAARVHLSSIKTFLLTEKNSDIRNIFIVMSDKESYEVYEQYYKRIFK